jgi:hypothetical protein
MSASAPLGSPSRNTGIEEAVCTRAMSVGDVVSEVMIHAAVTSFIHMQMFEASHTSHSIRKVRSRSGRQAEAGMDSGAGTAGRLSLIDLV